MLASSRSRHVARASISEKAMIMFRESATCLVFGSKKSLYLFSHFLVERGLDEYQIKYSIFLPPPTRFTMLFQLFVNQSQASSLVYRLRIKYANQWSISCVLTAPSSANAQAISLLA